ncbi:MAG: hypothetical protein P8J27_04315 [Mariniblastus sp.]|nr:hypothetical protein [Mariniblastus sp.]
MKIQRLRLLGLSLLLAGLPMVASAQQGISASFNDSTSVALKATVTANPKHTISLNQYGGLDGRVASIDGIAKTSIGLSGLDVFFVNDGQIVKQTRTSANGIFKIDGLAEGAYSFYAAGKNGLAAYGVYVTNEKDGAKNILQATTASSSYRGVQKLILRNAPPQVVESMQTAGQITGQASAINPLQQIRLINGRLFGQVSSLFSQTQSISGLQVQLIQNDEPIAQVQTSDNGSFSVPDVEPGVYDYVIGGINGFAAGRLEVIGNTRAITQVSFRRSSTQLDACLTGPTTKAQPAGYTLGNSLMEPSYANTAAAPTQYAGESMSYGSASGGSCGACNNFSGFGGRGLVRGRFGGMGGGGGGLGRLVTLGALGGAIVAIADDDSGPTSPTK